MKISKTNSSKKKVLIALASVFLIVSGSIILMHHYQIGLFQSKNTSTEEKIDLQKPTGDQVNAGTVAKNDFDSRTTEASQERQMANGEVATPNKSENVQTIISSSNVNGSTLSVRSIIQSIDKSGTCSLTLSKTGSQSISRTASTNTMGSYTTCAGFDIDISVLAKGNWEIKLIYTGSEGQNGIATKMVTL